MMFLILLVFMIDKKVTTPSLTGRVRGGSAYIQKGTTFPSTPPRQSGHTAKAMTTMANMAITTVERTWPSLQLTKCNRCTSNGGTKCDRSSQVSAGLTRNRE